MRSWSSNFTCRPDVPLTKATTFSELKANITHTRQPSGVSPASPISASAPTAMSQTPAYNARLSGVSGPSAVASSAASTTSIKGMDAVPNVQDIEERAALLDVERGPGDYGATTLPVNDANGEYSMYYKSCWAGVLGIGCSGRLHYWDLYLPTCASFYRQERSFTDAVN